MLFPTLGFALFFLVVYLMAWALKGSNEWRKIALLLASWFFYGAWDPRFVALLFASGLGNWAIGQGIVRARTPVSYQAAFIGYVRRFDAKHRHELG